MQGLCLNNVSLEKDIRFVASVVRQCSILCGVCDSCMCRVRESFVCGVRGSIMGAQDDIFLVASVV